MSRTASPGVKGSQPTTTTEDYYQLVKTAAKYGDVGEVDTKLCRGRADTSVASPSTDQIDDYLVPQATRDDGQPQILESKKLLCDWEASVEPSMLHCTLRLKERYLSQAHHGLPRQEGADSSVATTDITVAPEAPHPRGKGTPLQTAFKWANEEAKAWLLGHGAVPKPKTSLEIPTTAAPKDG
ncbi:hypothetical protein XPA_003408 [Xanthoria parietina]